MTECVHTIIIGGGIVGCAVQYHLARLGLTDSLLLERLELTSGSTWHAAGNITHFGHYAEITRLYADSLETYKEAEAETGQSIGFHETGSLRLATTQAELEAYKRLPPLYETLGVPYEVVTPRQVTALNPLVEPAGLWGAAHTPADGHIDASGATHAMAKGARNRGAEIWRRCPVHKICRRDNNWEIVCDKGRVRTENIVLAASFWTRELALQIGLDLPLYALEHHEIVTDPIPALYGLVREVPTIRDPAAPSNIRQEGHSLLCGVYESEPVFWGTDGIPPEFGQEMLVPSLDRLEESLIRAMNRMPALGEAGFKTVNNGPLCFTPDGCPIIGPMPGYDGLWLAAGFPVGIGTGGGAGKFLAEWIVNGVRPYALPMVEARRFKHPIDKYSALSAIKKTYSAGYITPGRHPNNPAPGQIIHRNRHSAQA